MGDLAGTSMGAALDALASPREPAAAGVALAMSAATAAAVVELAATLAAKRLDQQERANGDDSPEDMRELARQVAKLRARLLACANGDGRAYARVIKSRAGHERDTARARASGPPLGVAEGAAAVAERAAEVADAGSWTFTADAVVAAQLAAATARGCAELIEANLAGQPGDSRPARARAAADL